MLESSSDQVSCRCGCSLHTGYSGQAFFVFWHVVIPGRLLFMDVAIVGFSIPLFLERRF